MNTLTNHIQALTSHLLSPKQHENLLLLLFTTFLFAIIFILSISHTARKTKSTHSQSVPHTKDVTLSDTSDKNSKEEEVDDDDDDDAKKDVDMKNESTTTTANNNNNHTFLSLEKAVLMRTLAPPGHHPTNAKLPASRFRVARRLGSKRREEEGGEGEGEGERGVC
jgi:cytoskeletal protein RodZ